MLVIVPCSVLTPDDVTVYSCWLATMYSTPLVVFRHRSPLCVGRLPLSGVVAMMPPVFMSSVHMLLVVSMASRLPAASKPRRTTLVVLAPGVPTSTGACVGLLGSQRHRFGLVPFESRK